MMSETRLNWPQLLSTKRVRDLVGERTSLKSAMDLRTEFERDYGRTIYSTPFRRLRDKAQVFPLEHHDAVRTRLTHSQEVSSVAEDLASQVVREVIIHSNTALSDDDLRSIPLIAATCGLVHDIGNPPFGHAGELAILTWFEAQQRNTTGSFLSPLGSPDSQLATDFLHFEGNAHAVRILSNMELLIDNRGLNFTAATLSAACKYLAPSDLAGGDPTRHELLKPGFFFSEQDIVQIVRTETATIGIRHPITYLVEAADDIVYCSVDLEDGVKKGILDWPTVQEQLADYAQNASVFMKALARAREHVAPATALSSRAHGEALAAAFRIALISEMAIAVVQTFKIRYRDIMDGRYHGELLFDPACDAAPVASACKRILRDTLYQCHDILRLEVRGRKVIHELMDLFWEGIAGFNGTITTKTYAGKLYLLISDNYRRRFEQRLKESKEPELYCRLQLLTDQVAGMTDTHACRLHKDLTNG